MYRLDSHIHCQYSPDSSTKIDDIIKKSIEDKIDIIAISDHNTVEGSKVAVEKTKNTENLLVIPSIEISSSKGHILGFGCEEVVPRDLEPEETIDMIHDQGGLAIIPHPFCFYRHGLLCKSNPDELNFDAIETRNARFIVGWCNFKAKKLADKKNIPSLGASDSHHIDFLGDCYSLIDCELDIDSVLKSIKNLEHKPTCIIITHRPGALAICDRILRLEDGNLIEESKDFAFEVASDLV